MRTRNADAKKTPPAKKPAATSSPKTTRASAKKTPPKTAAAASSDPKSDNDVEENAEVSTSVEAKKPAAKKAAVKAKSPQAVKGTVEAAAAMEVKAEETEEEKPPSPEKQMEENVAKKELVEDTMSEAVSDPNSDNKDVALVEEMVEAPVEEKEPDVAVEEKEPDVAVEEIVEATVEEKQPDAVVEEMVEALAEVKEPDAGATLAEVKPENTTEEPSTKNEKVVEETMEEEVLEEEINNDANVEEAVDTDGGEGEQHMEEVQEEMVEEEEAEKEEDVVAEVDLQMEISDMAEVRKIRKEQEIFVGGLDRDAEEDDIRKVFEKVGEVIDVRLHRDLVTKKNKGFAFVKFASKELANKALVELKTPVIRGKRCGIAPREDNDTLFLGNICNTWTKEAIKRKLKDYGVDTVETVTLVADPQNEGVSRGFAFVEFPSHSDALSAYQRLQKPDVVFGHPDRTAKVAFAEPIREPDPEVMAQVKSVFVDGMPPYWDEDRVKEQFKGYGEIERIVLARNMSTARRKDFGFVNFTTHEAAVAFIEGVNNTELGDEKSKAKVRARLANPLPKTQAIKGGMSGGFRIGQTAAGYSRFGRGFGRGRLPFHRGGFQGSRGFYPRGRGRGRFPFVAGNVMENQFSEFRGGWRPFGARGGRRIAASARRGGFDRGRGNFFPGRRGPFPSGMEPFPPGREYLGPYGAGHIDEDPYFYGDVDRGMKRPFSMMEHDPAYFEPGIRMRPRYDHPDPMPGANRFRGRLEMPGPYSRDYYGPDYGDNTYSSFYGGEASGSGYYY